METIRKQRAFWLFLHFLLLTICLNFPVMFQITRLEPNELYNRLYSGSAEQLIDNTSPDSLHYNYGRNTLLPILGFMFMLMLIIQTVFYLTAVFFIRISRMNVSYLSFRDRMGLSLFSSTLPAFAASLFGLFLPTVHIIVYYFIIIFIVFQRSKLCPNEVS